MPACALSRKKFYKIVKKSVEKKFNLCYIADKQKDKNKTSKKIKTEQKTRGQKCTA